jgi:exopolysaccharide production protein ExoQ
MILNAPGSAPQSTDAEAPRAPVRVLGLDPENRRLSSPIGPAAAPAQADDEPGVYGGKIAWGLCFCSFLGLQLNQRYGMPAAVIFLAPWLLLIVQRLPRLMNEILQHNLLLLSPAFAILSTVWSAEPPWTMRAGIQYLATVVIGIAAGTLVKRRHLLTSLLAALAVVTLASLLQQYREGGFQSLHGIGGLYGSKNQFAASSAVQFIGAAYLLFFSRDSIILRLAGCGLALLALIGIYFGHSAGTTVALAGAMMTPVMFWMVRRTGAGSVLVMAVFGFMGLMALAVVGAGTVFSGALGFLGKDATLTGRTDLWAEAFKQMQENLLLGNGYQAFWRQGNPTAEKLWAMFGITARGGFTFHNEFINTSVDLGLIGLLISVTVLAFVTVSSLKGQLRRSPSLETGFHTIFFFFLLLTMVEAEFFYQFLLSPVILCITWSDYLGHRPRRVIQPVATAVL